MLAHLKITVLALTGIFPTRDSSFKYPKMHIKIHLEINSRDGWAPCVVSFTAFYGFHSNLVWVAVNSDLVMWQTLIWYCGKHWFDIEANCWSGIVANTDLVLWQIVEARKYKQYNPEAYLLWFGLCYGQVLDNLIRYPLSIDKEFWAVWHGLE